ncbi:hypothetical protein MAA5396_03606 [Marinovum algicola]|jgi:hypothetical protein|nr:hypothetical protein MALG_00157 [Marinovum algicola DG 898]SLN67130.1 hypothetical protein MAA5396_03606 [Marinovum algicola]
MGFPDRVTVILGPDPRASQPRVPRVKPENAASNKGPLQ